MTYTELKEFLDSIDNELLDNEVSIYDEVTKESSPVSSLMVDEDGNLVLGLNITEDVT